MRPFHCFHRFNQLPYRRPHRLPLGGRGGEGVHLPNYFGQILPRRVAIVRCEPLGKDDDPLRPLFAWCASPEGWATVTPFHDVR